MVQKYTSAEALPKVKSKRNKILTFLLILVVNVGIIAYLAIKEFSSDANQAQNVVVSEIKPLFLLFAVLCFVIALLMEAFKYESMLCFAEGHSDVKGAFECAILGKYYDNVTPLGAGGQPFQIYYLRKRGCSNGTSAALPVAGFLTLQTAFCLIAGVIFIANRSVVDTVPVIRYSAYVGLLFYLFIPICILLFTIFPKSFSRFICAIIRLLHKLHLIKDADKTSENWISTLAEYRENLQYLAKIPHLLFNVLFYSLIYQVAIMSIPFFVLLAFGGSDNWYDVFSLVVYIYAAITFVPTPGNAGAAEGSFYSVFLALSGGYLFWAVLIWRFLVYYIWLILGMCLTGISALRTKRPEKDQPQVPQHPRAAQFLDVFYPSIDGVVRTVHSYAKRMDGCAVICPAPISPYRDDFNFDVVRIPTVRVPGIVYPLALPRFSKKARRYLTEHHFDVYHVHSPFLVGHFALRMGRKLGVPVIATFHSKYYDDIYANTHSKFLARMVVNYIVKFYCKVDAVWACSEGTAQTLRSYGYRGEITVMDNGIDPVLVEHPEDLRKHAFEQYHLPEDKHLLLFVGHQIWQKNLRLVLDTMKQLREKNDNYRLLLVGRGYHEDAIHAYADKLGLQDCVSYFGQIDDESLLRGLYLASDLFFFPSVYDNAPLVVREAAMMGLPSLLVAGANAAEPVTDGVNGYTAEDDSTKMAQKIEEIFSSDNRFLVADNAKHTIPVSWDTIVDRAEQAYRHVRRHSFSPKEEPQPLAAKQSD